VLAFISYAFGILFSLFMAVGVPSTGGCGLVGGLWLIPEPEATFAMVYSFIMAGVWALNGMYYHDFKKQIIFINLTQTNSCVSNHYCTPIVQTFQ
jgi:hypothetical protein